MNLRIKGTTKKGFNVKNARTIKNLQLPHHSLNYEDLCAKHPHLRNLPIQSHERICPTIMIGLNNSHLLMGLESKSHKIDEPIATKTKLGWVLYGQTNNKEDNHCSLLTALKHLDDDTLYKMMESCFGRLERNNQSTKTSSIKRNIPSEEKTIVYVGHHKENIIQKVKEKAVLNVHAKVHRKTKANENKQTTELPIIHENEVPMTSVTTEPISKRGPEPTNVENFCQGNTLKFTKSNSFTIMILTFLFLTAQALGNSTKGLKAYDCANNEVNSYVHMRYAL